MPNYDEVLVTGLFLLALTWESLAGIYRRHPRPIAEWLVDGLSFLQLPLIKGSIVLIVFGLATLLVPEMKNSLQELPFFLGFLLIFLPDDLSHYWLHRLAHEHPRLWGFHRTHHTPTVYQVSIAFRENWMWFWVMPGFWWTGFMVYLGLLEEALLSTAVIGAHNVWLHTGTHWDQRIYRKKSLRRFVALFEMLVNTPNLHRAHHGLGENGVPMGNYAQTLFIWDVIFGTATFNRGALPERYGTTNPESMKQSWYYNLWWPLFKKRVVSPKLQENESLGETSA